MRTATACLQSPQGTLFSPWPTWNPRWPSPNGPWASSHRPYVARSLTQFVQSQITRLLRGTPCRGISAGPRETCLSQEERQCLLIAERAPPLRTTRATATGNLHFVFCAVCGLHTQASPPQPRGKRTEGRRSLWLDGLLNVTRTSPADVPMPLESVSRR